MRGGVHRVVAIVCTVLIITSVSVGPAVASRDTFADRQSANSGTSSIAAAEQQAGPPPIRENPPTDPNGDGLYEDVNGNGEWDFADVVTYYANFQQPIIRNHTAAYDYNDNNGTDFDDVVRLYQRDYVTPEQNETDADGDGLTREQELSIGTNATDPDTDGDFLGL